MIHIQVVALLFSLLLQCSVGGSTSSTTINEWMDQTLDMNPRSKYAQTKLLGVNQAILFGGHVVGAGCQGS